MGSAFIPAIPSVKSIRLDSRNTLIVVIDAQVGFCDPSGTLGQVYGVNDLLPVLATVRRLASFLESLPPSSSVLFATSEYPFGLHTSGVGSDPLAGLCVPGNGHDCDIVADISPKKDWRRVVKHQVDAWSSSDFRLAVERTIDWDRPNIVVTGFMATTCVRETVVSMLNDLGPHVADVLLVFDLIGARASSAVTDHTGTSRLDRAYADMIAAGARQVESFRNLDWLPEP